MAPRFRSLLPPLALTLACLNAACAASSSPAASAQSSAPPEAEAIGRSLLALTPNVARALGMHEFDGHIADFSAAGVERRIATLRELQARVIALSTQAADADATLDAAVLRQMIARDLFELTEMETWRTNPTYYSELFNIDEYIVRDYAPKQERAKALLSHLREARAQVQNVRANLRSPLAEPVVKTAIDIFAGFGQYLRGDAQTFIDSVEDPAVRAEAKDAAIAIAGEAEAIASHLRSVELPKADQSHVLGRERYEHLLQAQEALDTPIEELEKMAEDDLAKNRAAYEALAQTVQKSRPKASELLNEVRQVMDGARDFVLSHHIATLPVEPHVEVKETPPFMRWNSAFLNPGGVFDRADLPAYYYVTLPDPSWAPKEQEEYVMSRGEIVSTTVHEVFPGHYLQGLWQRSAPTFMQKISWSYSFGEGWAHYAEQMMVDEGFAADRPEVRLGQLSDALVRNCRFVASIGIHVRGMSVDTAKRRFVEDCKQDEAGARQQALRGTFDPGYFAYTLGKLQILALRDEAQQRLGARFELGKFHDALLAHGAPPLPLIRARVLEALGVP
ncbi:MAG TPA: DUF885 domain-containing protein [Polyangiaceae bacterium]|nr:DUF885 domain-containing protein [Polyangiaceae bacterium]